MLSINDIAKMIKVHTSTVRAYKARGYMPTPDVVYDGKPLWKPATINNWISTRRKSN